MPDTKIELRMRLISKTDLACNVTACKSANESRGKDWWLPRSLMGRTQTSADPDPGNYALFTFTLPEWKIDQDDLWDFTTS